MHAGQEGGAARDGKEGTEAGGTTFEFVQRLRKADFLIHKELVRVTQIE